MFSQSIAILIMGVCGSGKTAFGKRLANKLGFQFLDADDYHPINNKTKMQKGIPLTDEDRQEWLLTLAEFIEQWLEKNENGILACSALKEKYRQILISQPKRTKIIYLKGDYDLIAKRLAIRQDHFMNPLLLSSQFEILEEPEEAIYLDASLPVERLVNIAITQLALSKSIT